MNENGKETGWSIAHVVDPARLRMEVLNPDRLRRGFLAAGAKIRVALIDCGTTSRTQ